MSRIPSYLLTSSVGVAVPGGLSSFGSDGRDLGMLRAHVEDKATLRVDERSDSSTLGALVTMTTRAILQLNRDIVPGSIVTMPDGRKLTAASVRHFEHPHAPSNTDLGLV